MIPCKHYSNIFAYSFDKKLIACCFLFLLFLIICYWYKYFHYYYLIKKIEHFHSTGCNSLCQTLLKPPIGNNQLNGLILQLQFGFSKLQHYTSYFFLIISFFFILLLEFQKKIKLYLFYSYFQFDFLTINKKKKM